jgi:hypothetical protein
MKRKNLADGRLAENALQNQEAHGRMGMQKASIVVSAMSYWQSRSSNPWGTPKGSLKPGSKTTTTTGGLTTVWPIEPHQVSHTRVLLPLRLRSRTTRVSHRPYPLPNCYLHTEWYRDFERVILWLLDWDFCDRPFRFPTMRLNFDSILSKKEGCEHLNMPRYVLNFVPFHCFTSRKFPIAIGPVAVGYQRGQLGLE